MMKRIVAIIVLLSLLGLLAGCKLIQESRNDPTIAKVELNGNPTTGFSWVYTIAPDDIIKIVSEDYIQDSNPQNFAGVGGTFVFIFEAVAQGEATVTFHYLRPWEDVPPIKTVVYKAVVDEQGSLKLELISDLFGVN